MRHPDLPVRARAGEDSLWRRLLEPRARGALPKENVKLQRAAVSQAREAFSTRMDALAEHASLALREHDEAVSPRDVRARNKGRLRRDNVRISGVGVVRLDEPVHGVVLSAQLVERGGAVWLHAQSGQPLPEPKHPSGPVCALHAGITHSARRFHGTCR